jgi:mannose-6-phosphate isomerase
MLMKPIILEPNLVERPYLGGKGISEFRGIVSPGDHFPEDWIGSTTTVYMNAQAGLSLIGKNKTLREAIKEDPQAFLGSRHVEKYGANPAILVKILDPRERLAVHIHPGASFSKQFLGSDFGKTEAWYILDTFTDQPQVHLGFNRSIERAELIAWVENHQHEQLLRSLNRINVQPGDCLYVPGGVPHAIGEGILLIEIQEPTDLLVRLENRYETHGFQSDLGLGYETALEAVDLTDYSGVRLEDLWFPKRISHGDDSQREIENLLPESANRYFRLQRICPRPSVTLEQAFSILIPTKGRGVLQAGRDFQIDIHKGSTILVPWATGEIEVTGNLEIVRCLPPLTNATG